MPRRKKKRKEPSFNPQKDDIVYVCYDGKMGRCVKGKVLDTAEDEVLVEFDEWSGEGKGIQHWFKRESENHFGGFVPVKESLMKMLFGSEGDWYSVISKADYEHVHEYCEDTSS